MDEWLRAFRKRVQEETSSGAHLPPVQLPRNPLVPRELPRRLWIYWAQGWDNAPRQSKLCLESWRTHNQDWEINALDNSSIETYADLNELMIGKTITINAQANFIRMNLLAEYGGVWVDASTFCSRRLSDWLPHLLQSGFFAFSRPGPDRLLSNWFLAAEPNNYIIINWLEAMRRYWRLVTQADFYFWMHYLFSDCCRADDVFNAAWHSTPWISADGPHAVQRRADEVGAEDLRLSLRQRRVPIHKLQTRRPTLPTAEAQTPLAWLLHDSA